VQSDAEIKAALDTVTTFYQGSEDWCELPPLPPAWEIVNTKARGGSGDDDQMDDGADSGSEEIWGEPRVQWYSQYAAKILPLLPLEQIVQSPAKDLLLNFLSSALKWTNEKNVPPWARTDRRRQTPTRISEWTHALGDSLGNVSGWLSLQEVQSRFLARILELEDEDACWKLLSPFVSCYVCAHVYDAAKVPEQAIAILDLCLGKLLGSSTFERDSYRSGELSGYDEPRLAETLMFARFARSLNLLPLFFCMWLILFPVGSYQALHGLMEISLASRIRFRLSEENGYSC